MSGARNDAAQKELIPLDLTAIPLEQDENKRRSMWALAQRFRQTWEGWHRPFRVPSREEFISATTEDFVLAYNGSPQVSGVDEYLALCRVAETAGIDVTMSAVILEVAEDTAWIHDVHQWTMRDGYRFVSGRYGRLYRRSGDDRVCRWEVLQTNPFAAQEFFDTRFLAALGG